MLLSATFLLFFAATKVKLVTSGEVPRSQWVSFDKPFVDSDLSYASPSSHDDSSSPNEISISQSGSVTDDFADIIQYMPPDGYKPHRRLANETDEQYEKRIREGIRRHSRRRYHVGMLIRETIRNNQDSSQLTREIQKAVGEKKHKTTEKIKANENELARMGIHKEDFSKLSIDDPARIKIMHDITKKRAQRARARRLQLRFENSNDREKQLILEMAFKSGTRLSEVTGSNYNEANLCTMRVTGYNEDPTNAPSTSALSLSTMPQNESRVMGESEGDRQLDRSDKENTDEAWLTLGPP